MSSEAAWRDDVRTRDGQECAALQHAAGCRGMADHAHHIVYRSHLTPDTMWLPANGIALSLSCHELAHRTHNASLPSLRVQRAVEAVNAHVPEHLRVPEQTLKMRGVASHGLALLGIPDGEAQEQIARFLATREFKALW